MKFYNTYRKVKQLYLLQKRGGGGPTLDIDKTNEELDTMWLPEYYKIVWIEQGYCGVCMEMTGVWGQRGCEVLGVPHGVCNECMYAHIQYYGIPTYNHKCSDGKIHKCEMLYEGILEAIRKGIDEGMTKLEDITDGEELVTILVTKTKFVDELKKNIKELEDTKWWFNDYSEYVIPSGKLEFTSEEFKASNWQNLRSLRNHGETVVLCPACTMLLEWDDETKGCSTISCGECRSKGLLVKICVYCFDCSQNGERINIGLKECKHLEHTHIILQNLENRNPLPMPIDFR